MEKQGGIGKRCFGILRIFVLKICRKIEDEKDDDLKISNPNTIRQAFINIAANYSCTVKGDVI